MTTWIYPYHPASRSAKALAEALGIRRLRQNTSVRPRPNDLVINWGRHSFRILLGVDHRRLNDYNCVLHARNKHDALRLMEAGRTPVVPYTTDVEVAREWGREGQVVIGRRTLTGQAGSGIEVYEPGSEIPPSLPLYTKYVKGDEFRVHVFMGEVIDCTQKKKCREATEHNIRIRTHNNGWIFARDGVTLAAAARDAALSAMQALGLHFGAVDLRVSRSGAVYVLEVNTAPGLEGTTLINYTTALRNYIEENRHD